MASPFSSTVSGMLGFKVTARRAVASAPETSASVLVEVHLVWPGRLHRSRWCRVCARMLRSFPVSAVLALALSCVAAVGFAASLEPNLKLHSDSAAGASLPIEVRSQSSGGHLQGTVVSEIDLAFPVVADALARVSSWCELLPLHLNVKACVHGRTASGESLVIFIGRKFYRDPDDAYLLEFDFSVRSSSTRLELVLHSEGGALGARDCTLELSAEPRGDRTRLQLDFSQQYGVLARVVLASYLRTLGRS